jgi:hypothetical protein
MPTTISDLWIPDIWLQTMREKQATFPSLLNSGVVNPRLSPAARVQPPATSSHPFGMKRRCSNPRGKFELPAYPSLILKENHWRWPQRNLAGNTIDFFVQVLHLSFHNAMREIVAS